MITLVEPARWLPSTTHPLVRALVVRALADMGILEMPPGSNRSGVIDDYNRRAGVAVGSYWCASAYAAWREDVGLSRIAGSASCQHWYEYGEKFGLLVSEPVVGAAVLYGTDHAHHIGLITRVTPRVLSCEGNTTVEGGGATAAERNGVAVSQKLITPSDKVRGYLLPFAPGAH